MRHFFPLAPEARRHLERIAPRVEARLSGALPARDVEEFLVRLERHLEDLTEGLREVYGEETGALLDRLAGVMAERHRERPAELRRLDLERTVWPDWFQHPSAVGYVAYVDRFAGSLRGVADRLDYLEELGVTYLHLMPFLAQRPGDSDGGYAVADFRAVDPALGSMEDLEALTAELRRRGISLCCDLVLNHVAAEHPWAEAARAGDARYRAYFHVFDDRHMPDHYEESLPEIFPDTDPGSFTFAPGLGWVWTTFHHYQWDLNWQNADVFVEIADVILELANRGVEVFRLDAIAFLWKRLGTTCQNQPEVHAITRALRALARVAAPAVAFKAEAIVGPDDLIHYLGTGHHHGMVSDLAYHNSLMVQYWSSLAARDARVMTRALERFPPKPENTAWACYIRCHDDIGWAVSDEDAGAAGWDGPSHRRFLADFYAGRFAGSHARGRDFQPDEESGDCRTSGTTASLNGIERALELGDDALLDLAIERVLLGHALIMSWSGVPLLYMGDEIGLPNDGSYVRDPERAGDSRWLHRPPMDWERAERRRRAGTVEHRLFSGIRALVRARKATPHLHARWPTQALGAGDRAVFAHLRRHPAGDLLALYNFSEEERAVSADLLRAHEIERPRDRITGAAAPLTGGRLILPPYGRLWLTSSRSTR